MIKDKRYMDEKTVEELKKLRNEGKRPMYLAAIMGAVAIISSFIFFSISYNVTAIMLGIFSTCELILMVGLSIKITQITLLIYMKEHE